MIGSPRDYGRCLDKSGKRSGRWSGVHRLLTTLGGGDLVFLILDRFTTNRAAGAVNGTAAEPGPSPVPRSVVDTTPCLDLTGGWVRWSCRAGPSDPGLYYATGWPNVTGRTLFAKFNMAATGTHHGGWETDPGGGFLSGFTLSWSGGTISVYAGAQDGIVSGIANNTECLGFLVMRTTGRFVGCQDPSTGIWYIRVDDFAPSPPNQQPYFGAFSAAPAGAVNVLNAVAVADLPGPWNDDFGIVTTHLAGARNPGDTYTHEADSQVHWDVDVLPAAGQIEIRHRIQDANNYWQITIESTGKSDLDEIVAGVPTQRATAAAAVAAGDRCRLHFYNNKVFLRSSAGQNFGLSKWAYGVANNFMTETDGELETEGVGGAVSDLDVWPWTLSGAAAGLLATYFGAI